MNEVNCVNVLWFISWPHGMKDAFHGLFIGFFGETLREIVQGIHSKGVMTRRDMNYSQGRHGYGITAKQPQLGSPGSTSWEAQDPHFGNNMIYSQWRHDSRATAWENPTETQRSKDTKEPLQEPHAKDLYRKTKMMGE